MEQLPDDMLVEILSRLPPSSLAASRCVSKHLCSIVDARRLLRTGHLLPLRLDAFYCISLASVDRETYLFARPSVARRIPGACLDFRVDLEVVDHCNGLLLLCDMVFRLLNPATRQSAALPKAPDPSIENMLGVATVWAGTAPHRPPFYLFTDFNLVYDPMAESPEHFEVFLIPVLLCGHSGLMSDNITINLEEQEWPPSTYRTHVFSSRSWRWEERSWVRQGEPTGTMADMLRSEHGWNHKAVYFRGALYVHYSNESVMRISISKDRNTYQMMRLPAIRSKQIVKRATFYLGKSEKGVYCALFYWAQDDSDPQFRVWSLMEEEMNGRDGQIHMKWLIKTSISLKPLLAQLHHCGHDLTPDEWRIIYNRHDRDLVGSSAQDDIDDEWDFENAHEIVLEAPNNVNDWYPIDFLVFHPYKEIVFFSLSWKTISYNLNTTKVRQLGCAAHIPVSCSTKHDESKPCHQVAGTSIAVAGAQQHTTTKLLWLLWAEKEYTSPDR
uniref:F-box domain-containing protein n=1 Tax=Zea mays TaxID=4577 RepID=A0A804QCH9_MAIZE